MNEYMIDKMPPAPTGDAAKDTEELCDYVFYLVEKLNYTLSRLSE